MGHSTRLRLSDVRGVFRLLGEVRELGADPQQWRRHALEGLLRLTGAYVGIGGLEPVPLGGNIQDLLPLIDVGWESPDQRQVYIEFMRAGALLENPDYAFLKERGGKSFARLRRELTEDAVWYRSEMFNRYQRAGGCDDIVYSRQVVPAADCVDMITLRGAYGARPFDRRVKQIVVLFHTELARLWQPPPEGFAAWTALPRHLQRIVDQLRTGCSEKEAAAALELSRHTVHTYVKELYRRLDVRSRGEAMTKLLWSHDFIPRLRD